MAKLQAWGRRPRGLPVARPIGHGTPARIFLATRHESFELSYFGSERPNLFAHLADRIEDFFRRLGCFRHIAELAQSLANFGIRSSTSSRKEAAACTSTAETDAG